MILTTYFKDENLTMEQIEQLEMIEVNLNMLEYWLEHGSMNSLYVNLKDTCKISIYQEMENSKYNYMVFDHRDDEDDKKTANALRHITLKRVIYLLSKI
ncbi:hypothetical protein D3C87_81060 [compost metagenome]